LFTRGELPVAGARYKSAAIGRQKEWPVITSYYVAGTLDITDKVNNAVGFKLGVPGASAGLGFSSSTVTVQQGSDVLIAYKTGKARLKLISSRVDSVAFKQHAPIPQNGLFPQLTIGPTDQSSIQVNFGGVPEGGGVPPRIAYTGKNLFAPLDSRVLYGVSLEGGTFVIEFTGTNLSSGASIARYYVSHDVRVEKGSLRVDRRLFSFTIDD